MNEKVPLRPDLAGRKPYGALQLDVPVRLNTNENPYPPPPGLTAKIAAAMAAAASGLNRYPDREAAALRQALAHYLDHGLTAANTWAANGSNEIIQQLLLAFGGAGRLAIGFEPSYAMHPFIAQTTGTGWTSGVRADDFGLDVELAVRTVRDQRPDLVFLTSPNNPTGTALPLRAVEDLCAVARGMVVVDEAYAEFARDPAGTALTLLPRYPRLVVVRTMSKAFALAGARVGYLAAAPAVIDALRVVRLPYHLSAVTQAVAQVALANTAEFLESVTRIRNDRDALVAWLRERGLAVADSDANFVLFGRFPDRRLIWHRLLDRGVLIREVGPPEWLRVSIGTPEDMAAFRQALSEVLDEQSESEPHPVGYAPATASPRTL